jgi:hypothetical protein
VVHGVVEEEGVEPIFRCEQVDEVFLKPGKDATQPPLRCVVLWIQPSFRIQVHEKVFVEVDVHGSGEVEEGAIRHIHHDGSLHGIVGKELLDLEVRTPIGVEVHEDIADVFEEG